MTALNKEGVDAASLVERLRPRWLADEPIARAVVSDDQAERRQAVTDFLVGNNALKSEARNRIEQLERQLSVLDEENRLSMQTIAEERARADLAERQLATARTALERIAAMEGSAGLELGSEHTITINGEAKKGRTRVGAFASSIAAAAIRSLQSEGGKP